MILKAFFFNIKKAKIMFQLIENNINHILESHLTV
jgi:hypothetical protein